MNEPQDRQSSNAPGHAANQGQPGQTPSQGEERYQTTREHAPTGEGRQRAGSPAGDSTEGNTADQNREERIRRRAYRLWEEDGRQDGHAEDYWHRAAQDLDREDADLQRSGSTGKGVAQNRA